MPVPGVLHDGLEIGVFRNPAQFLLRLIGGGDEAGAVVLPRGDADIGDLPPLTDDRAASEYLEQARVTTDYTLRTRLYRNFQVVFAKELPALPLFAPVYSYGVDSQVQGVQVAALYDPSDRLATFNSWYLLTRRALEQTEAPTPEP